MSGSRDMNDVRRLFADRMKEAASGTQYGTVAEVDEQARTCSVTVGGITYDNVLLFAIEDGGLKGGVVIPKQGSGVILARIGASNRQYVAMFSEVDKVIITIGDKMEVALTADGFKVVRDGAGLKKTLTDLCDAIAQLTVTTGVGPSGVPINQTQFDKIKQELDKYLEG